MCVLEVSPESFSGHIIKHQRSFSAPAVQLMNFKVSILKNQRFQFDYFNIKLQNLYCQVSKLRILNPGTLEFQRPNIKAKISLLFKNSGFAFTCPRSNINIQASNKFHRIYNNRSKCDF